MKAKKQLNVQSNYNVQQNVPSTSSKVNYTSYNTNPYFVPSSNYSAKGSINPYLKEHQNSHNESF